MLAVALLGRPFLAIGAALGWAGVVGDFGGMERMVNENRYALANNLFDAP